MDKLLRKAVRCYLIKDYVNETLIRKFVNDVYIETIGVKFVEI